MKHNLEHFNLNPEGKYPSDGSLKVEINAKRVLNLLPTSTVERTRDCIQIDYEGEKDIVILVTPESIELRLPTVEWTMGAYGPAASSRFWKHIESKTTDEELENLLEEALKKRRSEFKDCQYCRNSFPPEHRHSEDVCHGCAEKYLGVVH
jgi:hypothetical protein